jgi:hypothetical protein
METTYHVELTAAEIIVHRPPGRTESVRWDELSAVWIETNDLGPFVDDVFWILVGDQGGCVVPLGVPGEVDLLKTLQQLDDFDNEMVIKAMRSHENQRFLVWQRPHTTRSG